MQSQTKLINLFIITVCLLSSAFAEPGQPTAVSPRESVSSAGPEVDEPSFPYVAELTDDNVNVRSGPGTNYYPCGKLNTGDRVKVVARKYSWSHIVPPSGNFSWISKQYISIEPNNPHIGIVMGNAVRVYAGSDLLKPMHSTTVQLELNRGDKVELMGEELDDYYKITPPTGAYVWVLTQYTKPLGTAEKIEVVIAPKNIPPKNIAPKEEEGEGEGEEEKAEASPDTPAVVPARTPLESEKLKEYYSLAEQIKAEQAKPLSEQNYTEIKKAMSEIAGNKEAGKAARYAEFAVQQIGRCELAMAVNQAVHFQESQLQQIREQIENARTAELSKVPQLGGFVVIGQFQTSQIYSTEGLKHYRIIDDAGQTVSYALPEGSAVQMDLSEFIGRKVGLVGTVEPHPQTKGALVKFTEIKIIDTEIK